MKVYLFGWKEGMEKVSLSKLQMEYLKMPLKMAKENVDKLLGNQEIELEFSCTQLGKEFAEKSRAIGVLCKIVL